MPFSFISSKPRPDAECKCDLDIAISKLDAEKRRTYVLILIPLALGRNKPRQYITIQETTTKNLRNGKENWVYKLHYNGSADPRVSNADGWHEPHKGGLPVLNDYERLVNRLILKKEQKIESNTRLKDPRELVEKFLVKCWKKGYLHVSWRNAGGC